MRISRIKWRFSITRLPRLRASSSDRWATSSIPAGTLWLVAGILFLAAEAIAAAGFPDYSYAIDYISELGIPCGGGAGAGQICSPRAAVMNAGFIVSGILFVLGALAFTRAARTRGKAGAFLLLPLASIHAIGLVLVGLVHAGSREIAAGTYPLHVIGAGMAILGGNAAIVAASILTRRLGAPLAFGMIGAFLGGLGLLSLALLVASGHGGTAILPNGALERGSVYSIAIWEILAGLVLLADTGKMPDA
ncbi:MAG: hypothetical protein JWO25_1452 [Alphaproteobacteria bacterium]|nr:hypothetical protein [Alphaproteobacteria bacterium]